MSYRQIKRICRGEIPYYGITTPDDLSDIASTWPLRKDEWNAGRELTRYICDVIYKPLHANCYDTWYCIYEQENPIFWFECRDEHSVIYYLIGVKLHDLMKVLLNTKGFPRMIWGVDVKIIFFCYLYHLEYLFKQRNIKVTPSDFRGKRNITSYNLSANPELVYNIMSSIFINFIKRFSNGTNQQGRNAGKHKEPLRVSI